MFICSDMPYHFTNIEFNNGGVISRSRPEDTIMEFYIGEFYEKPLHNYKQLRILKDVTKAKRTIDRALNQLHKKLDKL